MYSDKLVRQLCAEICDAKDPEQVQELVSLLQAVIRDDQEEARTRMAFLAKKYANFLSDSNAAD